MAAGVLVEEGVVEEDAGLVDGGIPRHQGALPKVGASFVEPEDRLKHFLPDLRMGLDGLAFGEAEPELVDELAVVVEGLGGIDDALRLPLHRRSKAFLARNVGLEEGAGHRLLPAGEPADPGDEADGEVGAVPRDVVELAEMEAVEDLALGLEGGLVLLPVLDGIAVVGPCAVEDGLPEGVHRLALRLVREHFLRPGDRGGAGDCPLVAVLAGVDEVADEIIALLQKENA